MAKSKAKAAAVEETVEQVENEVSTQSADEGIAVQSANDGIAMFADTGDGDGATTPVTPPSQPSAPSGDSEEVKWFTYAAYTHGVNFGYATPTKQVYQDILVALNVTDSTTQNAVFKALGV